jgi:putative transposase
VNLRRQIEVAVRTARRRRARKRGLLEPTPSRWRKECGGLQVDQTKRLKELEQENAKLKRLVAELSLDKLVLKDIAARNFEA